MHRSSELTNELFAAFAKAQAKFTHVKKTKTNDYFKSTHEGIEDILDVVRSPLAENGLGIFQDVYTSEEGKDMLQTMLTHSSGQWRSSGLVLKPGKNDNHSFASCVTYMKRTMLKGMLGLGVTDDADDDDGNKASGRDIEKKRLVIAQLEDVINLTTNPAGLTEKMLAKFEKETMFQMSEDQLNYMINHVNKMIEDSKKLNDTKKD